MSKITDIFIKDRADPFVTKGSDGLYYFTLDALTAVQINDKIDAVLHLQKGETVYRSQIDAYSISDYALNMFENSLAGEELKSLCVELIRYGIQAQNFKQYRTDLTIDHLLTESQQKYLKKLEDIELNNN